MYPFPLSSLTNLKLFFKLPNDNLNLRQPIDITSISYLASSSKQTLGSGVHLVTGTQVGDVRRYDTRAARKPVANWAGIGKVGGVNNVKAGLREQCVNRYVVFFVFPMIYSCWSASCTCLIMVPICPLWTYGTDESYTLINVRHNHLQSPMN